MKFLLVNTNAAVKKIFSIAANKAVISLDIVESIKDIPIQEDYACIFIDDGVLYTGNFQDVKSKMITTRFFLMLSKDTDLVSGFDDYIRKPFLPTDIYDVFKKEKSNYIDLSVYNDVDNPDKADTYDDFDYLDVLDAMADDDLGTQGNTGFNDIDLSEFSDVDDEFLSGAKDPVGIPDLSYESLLNDTSSIPSMNEDGILSDDLDINFDDIDDSELDALDPALDSIPDPAADDSNGLDNISLDVDASSSSDILNDSSSNTQTPNPQEAVSNDDVLHDSSLSLSGEDDIDFSSIFALQDELLKEQSNKPKSIIGGDIFIKKETKDTPSTNNGLNAEIAQDEGVLGDSGSVASDDDGVTVGNKDSNDFNDDFTNFEDDVIASDDAIASESSEPITTEEDNSSDIHLSEEADSISGDKTSLVDDNASVVDESYDFTDLDGNKMLELDGLSSDSNLSSTSDVGEPKILNKDTIDELTGILEDTNNTDNTQVASDDVAIEHSELGALTKEALNEAIHETEAGDGFVFEDDIVVDDVSVEDEPKASVSSEDIADESVAKDASEDVIGSAPESNGIATALDDGVNNNASADLAASASPLNDSAAGGVTSVRNTNSNTGGVNIDLTEIVKSFPVDKLRELLSGVQITINITFPEKDSDGRR